MANPLKAMGKWRGFEGAIEITVPITMLGATWYFVYSTLATASPGRAMTNIEVWSLLGCATAVSAWAISRQMYLGRKRNPRSLVIAGSLVSLLLAYLTGNRVAASFKSQCSDKLMGEMTMLTPVDVANIFVGMQVEGTLVCQAGEVADNPYLIGTLFRPAWDGAISIPLLLFLVLIAALASLAFRDVRLAPTGISFKVAQMLRFAPSAGSASAMGEPAPKKGKVVACDQATLWGETCGQIYSVEKEWYPGEWCQRCQQPFKKAPRRFTFKVVSLFTGDVDVLNGIERIDTVSWTRGDPISPDARLSGMERWVHLGTIDFPDVITVAQTLAIVHELIGGWAGDDVRKKLASDAATRRASKVACWFWSGSLSHRLTYARPTTDVKLAIGPQRLRDIIEDASEELWLQLDIGLLPLELRTGFKKTFVEDGRAPNLENSKFDLWVPTAKPMAGGVAPGLWVPRVEGDALRKWLSTDRLRDDSIKGVSIPLPYLRFNPEKRGDPGSDAAPKAGSIDLARYPLGPAAMEPVKERTIGASLAEWDWLEWEQIELLRREALVMEEVR